MMWEKLEPIRALETQSGLSRLLIYVYIRDSAAPEGIVSVLDHAGIHPGTGFHALRNGIELGLMTPNMTILYQTEDE